MGKTDDKLSFKELISVTAHQLKNLYVLSQNESDVLLSSGGGYMSRLCIACPVREESIFRDMLTLTTVSCIAFGSIG